MKVKVGDSIYDGEKQPVMVILSSQDKENIENMPGKLHRYCVYPSKKYTPDEILKWMNGDVAKG